MGVLAQEVIYIFLQAMIVLELMVNGALNSYLRKNAQ